MVTGSTKTEGSNGTVDKNARQRNPTSVRIPNDRRMNGNRHEHEHKRHDSYRKIFHHAHLPERAWPTLQNFTTTIKVKLADIAPGSQPSPPTTFNNVHDDLEPPVAHASLSNACVSSLPFPVNTPISQLKVLSLFSLQNSLSCPCSYSHSCPFSSQLMIEGTGKRERKIKRTLRTRASLTGCLLAAASYSSYQHPIPSSSRYQEKKTYHFG